MKKLFFTLALLSCIYQSYATDSAAHVVKSNDISTKQDPKKLELFKLAARLAFYHPRTTIHALLNVRKLKARGIEIKNNTPGGTTNIVVQLLKEFNYPELKPHVHEIVLATMNHAFNKAMLEHVKKMKKQGPVIITTNQDRLQFLCWQKRLEEHGVHFNELSDTFVTLWCPLDQSSDKGEEVTVNGCTYTQFSDGSIMCPQGVRGSSPEFNAIVEQLLHKKNQQS